MCVCCPLASTARAAAARRHRRQAGVGPASAPARAGQAHNRVRVRHSARRQRLGGGAPAAGTPLALVAGYDNEGHDADLQHVRGTVNKCAVQIAGEVRSWKRVMDQSGTPKGTHCHPPCIVPRAVSSGPDQRRSRAWGISLAQLLAFASLTTRSRCYGHCGCCPRSPSRASRCWYARL